MIAEFSNMEVENPSRNGEEDCFTENKGEIWCIYGAETFEARTFRKGGKTTPKNFDGNSFTRKVVKQIIKRKLVRANKELPKLKQKET